MSEQWLARYSDVGHWAYLSFRQLSRIRTFATVTDAPLDKKVEMTNWEKVSVTKTLFPERLSSKLRPGYNGMLIITE